MTRRALLGRPEPSVAGKDLPFLNDLQAAMQQEKHTGMFWTVGLLALLIAFPGIAVH